MRIKRIRAGRKAIVPIVQICLRGWRVRRPGERGAEEGVPEGAEEGVPEGVLEGIIRWQIWLCLLSSGSWFCRVRFPV